MSKPWWPLLAAAVLSLSSHAQTSPAPAASSASAPTASTLTLPQAVAQALSASAELSASRKEVAAVQAAREQARLWPNPQLEWQTEGTRRPERETTVAISQLVELGAAASARRAPRPPTALSRWRARSTRPGKPSCAAASRRRTSTR